jgi:lauroyl/myristoyl acyltransferase
MERVLPDILPSKTPGEIETLIDRNWSFIGRSMLRIGHLPRVASQEKITLKGLDRVADMQSNGQPVILAFVHLGLWELAAVELARHDIIPMVIYQPPANKTRAELALETRMEAYFERHPEPTEARRKALEENMLPGSPAAIRKVMTGLRKGGLAWFAVDECVGGHVHGPWFGKSWRRQGNLEIVSRLAIKTGAAIIPTWCLETSDGYAITYSEPILPDQNSTADSLSSNVANRLNPLVESNYEQWFMLHELRPDDFNDPESA